ncbi:meiosis-specific protein MEI4-like isoform 1-T1 [Salvelinus alpinus]
MQMMLERTNRISLDRAWLSPPPCVLCPLWLICSHWKRQAVVYLGLIMQIFAPGNQEAMLRLRQELLLTQMLSKPKNTSGADAGDGFMGLLSQDLVGPGSLKDQLNSDMDSGCGTENNKETLQPTQDSAEPPSAQPAFPPVNTMAPQIPFSSLCELSPRGKAMLLCMQFLQSLCWLNRVEGEVMGAEAGGLSLDRGGDGDRLVVEDSVCQLLSCVMAASRDARALPPHSLLLQVSLVAAQAVDHLLSHRQPSLKFVAHMEDALKELTELLLCNDQLNRFQVEERLTECLTLLGGNSLLRSLLIRHVLSEINRLAEHVWITCQGESSKGSVQFDVSQYENFYLVWLLEQLLHGPPGAAVGPGHHWT